MSYYVHPIFGHRAPSPSPAPSPYYAPHGHRHPHHYPHAHPFGPSPAHDSYDLEAQERAALAHLRHIQQRREAEQAAIQREASIRLRQQEEREAAIRKAIVQQEREQAIRAAIDQREQAIRAAVEQREKEDAIRSALIQQHRARQEQIARAKFEAYQQAKKQQFEQAMQKRVECAKRCAGRYTREASRSAAKEVKKEYKGELEMINGLLGGLFGINLKDEEEQTSKPEEKKEVVKETSIPATAPVAEKPEITTPAEPTNQSFPEDINDLLSQFLGLRIEPTSAPTPSEKASTGGNNKVPQGLNEFLSRFGLVFEPVDIAEEVKPESSAQASTTEKVEDKAVEVPASNTTATDDKQEEKSEIDSATVSDPPEPTLPAPATASTSTANTAKPTSAPAVKDDHPLTTFLNGFTDMPPFVRDILGNVELAFKEEMNRDKQARGEEEVKGKGKGVAEGEKKTVPAPAQTEISAPVIAAATEPQSETSVDPAATALSTLSSISDNLELLRSTFTFPSTLSFAPSSDSVPTPALLFNKTNSPYHTQAHNLLQLLLAADGVSSGGNKEVRRKRKEIVREVEREIERLETKRDEVWENVKERREKGEEEEIDEGERSGSSSCGSSTVDPEERHDVEHEHEHVEDVSPGAEGKKEEGVADVDVKETYAEAVKEDKHDQKEAKEEEGYELL